MSPTTAFPLLAPLYSPSHSEEDSHSHDCRYLVIVADTSSPVSGALELDETSKERKPPVRARWNWDPRWDGLSWDGIAELSKEKEIRCSCIVVGRGVKTEQAMDEDSRGPGLRAFCQAVSSVADL
jgi:hypothetical protein